MRADGGIGLANQEDAARDADYERRCDWNKAKAINGLATVFRVRYAETLPQTDAGTFGSVLVALGRSYRHPLSHDVDLFAVLEDYGPEAVLLALVRAYRQPIPDTSDVVEFP